MKRRNMKRMTALILAVGMVTGCGNSTSAPTSGNDTAAQTQEGKEVSGKDNKESNEISFWNIGTENPDKEVISYAVDQFNKETQSAYQVTSIPTQNDAYKEKLIIAMSSGECPDLYTNWSGGPMNEYIDAGYAQPIDELFANSPIKDKLLDATIAQGTYKGKLYSIGFLNVSVSGIYYNKEMFAQYGLEVPKTISEMEKVCDTLVQNGKIPFALANGPKWTGSMYFMNLAARKGGLEPFNNAVAGTGSFEDECFIYAGQKIQDWVKKGYFPEGVNSLSEDDGQARQLLYTESAAMTLIGSWYTGIIKSDSEEFYQKIGWFPFPAVDDSSADPSIMIGTIGDTFVTFNCTGEKQAEAFKMVENYFEEESINNMVASGKIPPIKGVSSMLQEGVAKEIMKSVDSASATQLWYDQYLPPAVAQVHLDTCQELFGLTKTPEEAAKLFQEAMVKSNSGK